MALLMLWLRHLQHVLINLISCSRLAGAYEYDAVAVTDRTSQYEYYVC